MNNTEAKFILNAYRPNGRDANDATFCAALDQAKSDPALGAWFAREQAHGVAVAAKLREVAPPAGLREAILAGGKVSGGNLSPEPKPATTRRTFWNQPVWLAAAAAIAVLVTVSVSLWPKRAAAAAALTDYALVDALEVAKHGGHGELTGAFQASLAKDTTRLAGSMPIDFAALKNNGCRTVSVAGHDVLEVCFKRDGAWFHCYVGRVEDFPEEPAKFAPNFAQSGKVIAATWADGTHRFVVASQAGRAAVERLL
jgi:hypothetical protein